MTILRKEKTYQHLLQLTGIIQMLFACYLCAKEMVEAKQLGKELLFQTNKASNQLKSMMAATSEWDTNSIVFFILGIIFIIRAIILVIYANHYNMDKKITPIKNYIFFGDPILHLPTLIFGLNVYTI